MNISIDIDGVLVDRENYQIEKAVEFAKKNNINFHILKIDAYNVDEMFGWDKNNFKAFWDEYLWDYAKQPPLADVKAILSKLRADGHKIIINTSRWLSELENEIGKKMRKTVEDWFVKNDLPFDELVFARGDKLAVVESLCADCHIEDNPIEAIPIAEKIPVIMLDCEYNKNFCGENIFHAKDWEEIYKLLMKF